MGREIRRVVPNWEHPKEMRNGKESYLPLYDKDYETARAEWDRDNELWAKGEHPDQRDKSYDVSQYKTYAEWGSDKPDPLYYRPKWTEKEATWFQLYETVSEGTPVSPPFATEDELIEYLVRNGDFWDNHRGTGTYSREAAEAVVRGGWAPSLVSIGGKIMSGVEGLAAMGAKRVNEDGM